MGESADRLNWREIIRERDREFRQAVRLLELERSLNFANPDPNRMYNVGVDPASGPDQTVYFVQEWPLRPEDAFKQHRRYREDFTQYARDFGSYFRFGFVPWWTEGEGRREKHMGWAQRVQPKLLPERAESLRGTK